MVTHTQGPLLEVEDLHVEFLTGGQRVEAISGASLMVVEGETVAVVGESGSGKSVTALSILGLLDNGETTGGRIMWSGTDLAAATQKQLRAVRGNEISMIFQDPMTSLDPLYSVGAQIVEAITLHRDMKKRAAWVEAVSLLDLVGIPDPAVRAKAYPHQLSGGQRQRVMIAMALACEPRLLIADEPTTALDVTVEAQVLSLIRKLQDETGVSVLLITHDMGVVAEMADRVYVFYDGQVVESGHVRDVLERPAHPYTAALLAAIPRPTTPRDEPMPAIAGTVPQISEMPSGCRFRSRCTYAHDRCVEDPPEVQAADGQVSRCWLSADARDGKDVPHLSPVTGEIDEAS